MPASQTRWERAVTDGLVFRSAAARMSRWTPGYQRVSVAGVANFPLPVSLIPRRKQACWMRPPLPSSTSTPSRANVPHIIPGDHHLSRIVRGHGRGGDGVRARHSEAAQLSRQGSTLPCVLVLFSWHFDHINNKARGLELNRWYNKVWQYERQR